jgi:CRISPR-associated protein Csb1
MTTTAQHTRHVYEVDLAPVAGSTFQPTGFPDLGAATFKRTMDGRQQDCLIVESVQSMANRLEATTWDAGAQRPVAAVEGLPYVEVVDPDGRFLTSSRLEAHRLFSAFVRDATWNGHSGDVELLQRLDLRNDVPLDYPAMARQILALDPLSLVHGVFFAGKPKGAKGRGNWLAQPKFTRAVTAVIEAHDVSPVASGGRKADAVRHNLQGDTEGGTAEGYGSVPFHRMEWTAERIVASVVIDRQLLGSYGLPVPATELLEALAMWEVRALFDAGLRLRTACDLDVVGGIAVRRGEELPDLDTATARLRAAVDASAAEGLLGEGRAVTVQWSPKQAVS